MESEGKLPSH